MNKLQRLCSWLGELRYVYLAFVCVLLGAAIIYVSGETERSIRLVGGGLQVMGLGTVVWGISKTRKQFGHPSVLTLAASWLRRYPLVRRTAYLRADGISVGAALVSGRLSTVFVAKPHTTLEDRLDAIEKGIITVQERVAAAESQIDRDVGATHGKIAAEARARESADQGTMKAIEAASTGGIYISAIGTVWLFAGVVLSTASLELSLWLK